ncbi:hypothetical protein LCGC14_2193990 [marine sediment metagenome]|uniref:Uncharacterized protein n=1 Tax=marine sediment metagenome TaxID=412755 RepID=A0A0F9GEF9_9ZZZZ
MNKVNINFPKTIKVGGFICKIVTGHTFVNTDLPQMIGRFEPTSHVIQLANTFVTDEGETVILDVATQWAVFFHELKHAMEALLGHTTGYGRFVGETLEDAEERITDTFSEAWMTVFRDNPDLCRALGNMPEDFAKEKSGS